MIRSLAYVDDMNRLLAISNLPLCINQLIELTSSKLIKAYPTLKRQLDIISNSVILRRSYLQLLAKSRMIATSADSLNDISKELLAYQSADT